MGRVPAARAQTQVLMPRWGRTNPQRVSPEYRDAW